MSHNIKCSLPQINYILYSYCFYVRGMDFRVFFLFFFRFASFEFCRTHGEMKNCCFSDRLQKLFELKLTALSIQPTKFYTMVTRRYIICSDETEKLTKNNRNCYYLNKLF